MEPIANSKDCSSGPSLFEVPIEMRCDKKQYNKFEGYVLLVTQEKGGECQPVIASTESLKPDATSTPRRIEQTILQDCLVRNERILTLLGITLLIE
jgi:hypothetical protein